MGFRINSAIASLLPQRELSKTTKAFQRSLERLSSGQRVNSARDDAAGLAISTRLDAQVRGMRQAIRNMNEAYGFIEVADGTLAVQADLVQRMRELATQAANGTLSSDDRSYLNEELQQLVQEFNRLTAQTTFNGTKLLDGSFETKALQIGAQNGETLKLTLASMQANEVFTKQQLVGTGTFEVRSTLANESPVSLLLLDLNADNAVDLLTCNNGSDTISVFLGTGEGAFTSASTLATGADPSGLEVSDFNSDGFLDLIHKDWTDQTLSVHLGNGNGTFQTRTTLPTGTGPTVIEIADLNADGSLDLINTDYNGNTVSISLGNGNGTFKQRSTLALVSPYSAIALDFDSDGILDLAVTSYGGNTISIYLGNGNGTFQAPTTTPTGAQPISFEVLDLNGDDALDLITADYNSSTLSISLGNGNGTFQVRSTVPTGSRPTLYIQDLNADGALDLISTDRNSNTVSISLGNGNGTFQSRMTLATGSAPGAMSIVDLNSDDHLDLVVADNNAATISIFVGIGNGNFKSRSTMATGSAPINLTEYDLNSDGATDLLLNDRNSNTTSIFIAITESRTTNPGLDISTQSSAQDMLEVFDNALNYISASRASLGALHSRVEFAESNAQNLVENLAQARSHILDTDYALETAEFARLQILQQAQIASLGQANLNLQLVLELLKGGGHKEPWVLE